MKRLILVAWLAALATLPFSHPAQAQHADYDALVASHARANAVPEALYTLAEQAALDRKGGSR